MLGVYLFPTSLPMTYRMLKLSNMAKGNREPCLGMKTVRSEEIICPKQGLWMASRRNAPLSKEDRASAILAFRTWDTSMSTFLRNINVTVLQNDTYMFIIAHAFSWFGEGGYYELLPTPQIKMNQREPLSSVWSRQCNWKSNRYKTSFCISSSTGNGGGTGASQIHPASEF